MVHAYMPMCMRAYVYGHMHAIEWCALIRSLYSIDISLRLFCVHGSSSLNCADRLSCVEVRSFSSRHRYSPFSCLHWTSLGMPFKIISMYLASSPVGGRASKAFIYKARRHACGVGKCRHVLRQVESEWNNRRRESKNLKAK